MKLLDLLVKELPRRGGWPEGVDVVRQNCKGQLFEIDSDYCSDFKLEKCDDWITDVVTKQQYETSLAASKAVVGHNGWIQWSGGECPVDSDAIVEVKYRSPKPYQYNNYNDRAGDFDWEHIGSNADIIAYRLQQPGIGSLANDDRLERDLNECIGQDIDVVNHPSHYTQGDIECIDAIKAALGEEQYEGYLRGACIKYLWRYKMKSGVESLKKAEWYLKRLIELNEEIESRNK